jgi:GNAT superfamily N-acetyltransferase
VSLVSLEVVGRSTSATSSKSSDPAPPVPAERVTLRDGSTVRIARITPQDAPLIAEGFERLSAETRRLRFLTSKPTLSSAELKYLTEVDGHRHEALGAIDPATGHGIAVARFVRDPEDPSRAEVAVTVADEWQHRGLGTLMLDRLADRAREEGIAHFTALVAGDNSAMQPFLQGLGGTVTVTEVGGGAVEYAIELAPRGLGRQLETLLRAAAVGHWQVPPRVCDALRALVPIHFPTR